MANKLLVTETSSGDPTGLGRNSRRKSQGIWRSITYVPFSTPGELADAVNDVWDVGLIGAEPTQPRKSFSLPPMWRSRRPTCYLPGRCYNRSKRSISPVSVLPCRSAVPDLFLTRNLKHAELVRAKGLPGATKLFLDEKCDALAGLRPLMTKASLIFPMRVSWTAVHHGATSGRCNKGQRRGSGALSDFVEIEVWVGG